MMKRIATLETDVEAQALEALLVSEGIPHRLQSYHDLAYDGLFQGVQGWGHIEAPEEREGEILRLLADLRSS